MAAIPFDREIAERQPWQFDRRERAVVDRRLIAAQPGAADIVAGGTDAAGLGDAWGMARPARPILRYGVAGAAIGGMDADVPRWRTRPGGGAFVPDGECEDGCMQRIGKRLATGLLFAVVGLCLAVVIVPRFLDRIYYRGPASDHFDGARFFNPGDPAAGGRRSGSMLRFMTGRDRAPWPATVPVTPGRALAALTPCPARTGGVVHEAWAQCVPAAAIDPQRMAVTWVGHATALIQTQRLAILTDPIWSDRASPVGFAGPKRVRAPGIAFDDLPKIDVVLISHNHYDHLDLPTLKALWARDKPLIVTSLGNDAILRKAGIPSVTRDWGGSVAVTPAVSVVVERVHHWGSRFGVDRNRALWSGFTIRLPGGNVFFAGDTGYGDGSWTREAAARGPVRLAILPIGAYEPRGLMRDAYMNPAEAAATFRTLGARTALGVHWGTFQLTDEAIDAPPRALTAALTAAERTRFRVTEAGVPWEVE
ncbi:MBL fold metallo-hydrolase [Sphingomonas montana]|uniref:MBL fold metallo-hydrolase n=1 Tax=Sphingomonas montana TaxID=1843236 RepID=UPI00096D6CB2|nr:MBL fold metallo-hydrolase [Sphingomonas montana]